MKKMNLPLFFLLAQLSIGFVLAQSSQTKSISYLSGLSIDMQWFLAYLGGEEDGETFNEFSLKRGYVNIKKKIDNTFSGRITTDITVDREGDGEGDVEIRLKYLYLKTQLPSFGLLNTPYFEFGMAHRPWLDFEEHVNFYRVQGTMFLERNHILNSADFGVVFVSLLGGEMDEHYQKTVNKNYAGTYGSIALGVFNGGGYHAIEKNKSKSFESRITIRPLHKTIPGLQFSYNGAIGKGNIPEEPDWNYNMGFVSYESSRIILTGSYYTGEGNSGGSAIKDTVSFQALPQNGYSFFGELKLFDSRISLIGRHDYFNREFPSGKANIKRTIAGLAFNLIPGSKILLDYDYVDYSDSAVEDSYVVEIAMELKY